MKKIPNWYVITGGPSSGKTTLIRELKDRGYKTVLESARNYIDLQLINGRDIEEIRLRQSQLQHKILDRQIETERNLDPDELTFLDRATPDSLAYYLHLGIKPDEKLVEWLKSAKFKKVFILDLLPLINDEVRVENRSEQLAIHARLIEVYKEYGEDLVFVPVLPPKERTDFVLSHLE
jgi:predicted ATPase